MQRDLEGARTKRIGESLRWSSSPVQVDQPGLVGRGLDRRDGLAAGGVRGQAPFGLSELGHVVEAIDSNIDDPTALRKQLREMDRRIRYLQKRLPQLKVVEGPPDGGDQVFFGAWVTLESDDGSETRYRIVGADEFDPKRNWISVDSPMARALLKRRADETVSVETPTGLVELLILEISYQGGS